MRTEYFKNIIPGERAKKYVGYPLLGITAVASVVAIGALIIKNFKPDYLSSLIGEGKGALALNIAASVGLVVLAGLVAGFAISNHKNKAANQALTTALQDIDGNLKNNGTPKETLGKVEIETIQTFVTSALSK